MAHRWLDVSRHQWGNKGRFLHVRVWRLILDCADWSLSRVESWRPNGGYNAVGLVALRCTLCRRVTFGCCDHWFCGLCESCRALCEDED